MIKSYAGNQIVCAKYQGKRGVPAVFPASFFDNLKKLSGDKGAKMLLQKTDLSVVELVLPEASMDIDTVTDLSDLEGHRVEEVFS